MHYNTLSYALYEPFVVSSGSDWAALYKPPGRETVSQSGALDMLEPARRLLGRGDMVPVHRLDRDTSGVQLFAAKGEAERGIEELFRKRIIHKLYLAICLGCPRNRSGTINRRLSDWEGGRRPVRVVRQGGLEATTSYRLLARSGTEVEGQAISLVAFEPHQGRTHQIRVHAASFGYPILGDDQYGDRAANRLAKERFGLERQALHCLRLVFPWAGETAAPECAPPPDMEAFERAFGSDFRKTIRECDSGLYKRTPP